MPRSVSSLCALLAAAVLSLGVAPSVAAQDPARTVGDTVPLAADGAVAVDTHEGTITVTTWERDRVRYEAEIMPTDGDPHAEKVTIQARTNDERLRLATDHEDGDDESTVFGFDEDGFRWGGIDIPAVHYTIRMPRSAALRLDDHESAIEVTGLAGALRIDTHEGPVTVTDQRGAVTIDSHESSLSITNQDGDVTLDTHEGRMDLRNIAGRLSVDTHEGTLSVEELEGSLRFDAHDGTVSASFATVTDDVHVNTHDGDATLALPPTSGVDLNTDFDDDVDLRSDFDLSAIRIGDEDEPNYRGDINGGGPELYLEADDGDVALRTR
ncbi:DUF4097 family beta strand repeat-containing protein [Salinibacter ruber]|uniref:DUF4097 family beta strand repeat-containing protein n=1 Tax=Salinibacter ruber TaxID=146919 RepID=UPI0021683C21|nr:DUF4097 family beta strand repeat-containing protein [Salinibacter ruber]MCS4199991.1 DUF4097 and DUF4098 domain-containing protein YvlB [Salinibacter ruber]